MNRSSGRNAETTKFGTSTSSLIFKSTQVTRFWDAKRRALVYLVYTDRIIEGSPRNSISVVPLGFR